MRPVNKGSSPDYHDAEPFLVSTIGYFCSYCEYPISHVPEVEHKESKNSGGTLTDWNNLLLGCKYCNSRKIEKVKKGEHDKWIWPDECNTFLAYTYQGGIPTVNEIYLQSLGKNYETQAKTLFQDLVLDNNPSKSKS